MLNSNQYIRRSYLAGLGSLYAEQIHCLSEIKTRNYATIIIQDIAYTIYDSRADSDKFCKPIDFTLLGCDVRSKSYNFVLRDYTCDQLIDHLMKHTNREFKLPHNASKYEIQSALNAFVESLVLKKSIFRRRDNFIRLINKIYCVEL